AASRRATAPGASRASSSIREINVLSFDEHALQLQVTVEHDEIGVAAFVDSPSILEAEIIGGVRGYAPRCLANRKPQCDEDAQRLVHRQRAAGQRAVRQADAAQAFGH